VKRLTNIIVISMTLLLTSFMSENSFGGPTVSFKEISYGTYHTTGVSISSKDSPSGRSTMITNHSLIRKTDTVDAVLGETFGMEFSIIAKTKKGIKVRRVWEFPKSMIDGRGNSFKESSSDMVYTPNVSTVTTYELEEDFEIIPGKWTIRFYYEDKLLHERTFHLVKR